MCVIKWNHFSHKTKGQHGEYETEVQQAKRRYKREWVKFARPCREGEDNSKRNPIAKVSLLSRDNVRFFWCFEGGLGFFLFCLLGPHPRHMEVPRLGVQSELQLLAYTTATATSDLSRICDLLCSSQQHRILNPLSGARDRIHNLMVPSRIHFRCTTTGTAVFWINVLDVN